MNSNHSKGLHQPFKDLERLIKQKGLPLAKKPAPDQTAAPPMLLSPRQETELFAKAMADVTPMVWDCYWRWPNRPRCPDTPSDAAKTLALHALCLLVEKGHGFKVSATSEYVEARGPGIQQEICRRLHRGQYAIQDHIDLHGLTVPEAKTALGAFIKKAIIEGKRAVLVVHGRGLSSLHEPVLKNKVYGWLTTGQWMKYVIALTSARACDGGAGASYVLLRRRPLSKRLRKAAFKRQQIDRW